MANKARRIRRAELKRKATRRDRKHARRHLMDVATRSGLAEVDDILGEAVIPSQRKVAAVAMELA